MKRLSDSQAYRQRKTLLTTLQEQLHEATRAAESIEAQRTPAVPTRDRDAEAIRAGRDLPTHNENGPAEQAWRKVRALERAVELERVALSHEKAVASADICKAERPRYESLLRKQAAAVEQLVATHKAEREFREELIANEVEFSSAIRPCGFLGLQDIPDDAERWFKELRESGYKL